MKSVLRKILLSKSHLYSYPYSRRNLNNELERIYEEGYFNRKTVLRGKRISQSQFSLWEKWNFLRGYYSFDALAYFSGTKFNDKDSTYIIGTIYPHPLLSIGFYFAVLLGLISTINQVFTENGGFNFEFILTAAVFGMICLLVALYFRWRIQTSVEDELKISIKR